MSSFDIMRAAIELARQGMKAGDGGPFGAIVVRDGKVIGKGWNQVLANNDPTAHGEIMAIRDACARQKRFSLEGCELYTTGEPCPMCLGAIQWARINRVFYGFRMEDAASIGFDDRHFYEQFALPADQRRIPTYECLRGEALNLIREYSVLPTRAKY